MKANIIRLDGYLNDLKKDINSALWMHNIRIGFSEELENLQRKVRTMAMMLLRGEKVHLKEYGIIEAETLKFTKDYYIESLNYFFNSIKIESGGKLRDFISDPEINEKFDAIESAKESFGVLAKRSNPTALRRPWKTLFYKMSDLRKKVTRNKRVSALKICGKISFYGIMLILTALSVFKDDSLPFPKYWFFVALGLVILFSYYLFGLSENSKRWIKKIIPTVVMFGIAFALALFLDRFL